MLTLIYFDREEFQRSRTVKACVIFMNICHVMKKIAQYQQIANGLSLEKGSGAGVVRPLLIMHSGSERSRTKKYRNVLIGAFLEFQHFIGIAMHTKTCAARAVLSHAPNGKWNYVVAGLKLCCESFTV